MIINSKISSLVSLFENIENGLLKIQSNENLNSFEIELNEAIETTFIKNSWFTKDQITITLNYWISHLKQQELKDWIDFYAIDSTLKSKKIGLILAGNIPLVGFHDVLCVLFTENIPLIKLSSKDSVLLPFILKEWKNIYKDLDFEIVEKLENFEAIIATGSENTSKYFEFYFKNSPHIIRKNRTSIAVLSGNESTAEMELLAKDVFTYFGLGCRSVTQLFLPKGFTVDKIYENFLEYKEVIFHHKYANNYDYHKAIFLLNQDVFWDNNFLLLKESNQLFSPLAVLFISYYEDLNEVENYINENNEKIQCVVGEIQTLNTSKIPFGQTQNPPLNTYADGIDTIQFLLGL